MKLVFREQLISLLVLFPPCRLLPCTDSSFIVQSLSTSVLQGKWTPGAHYTILATLVYITSYSSDNFC